MSDGCKMYGDVNYIHLDMDSGATRRLHFQPGIRMADVADLYPRAKARAMNAAEITAYRKERYPDNRDE